MAESKTVTVVPLNRSNYATWKVQCRMALMKDRLWSIVNGSEACPNQTREADKYKKVYLEKGSCAGHYSALYGSSPSVFDWRSQRSNLGVEETV